MEIASGHVTDRPFARTIYTIAARRFTGDLVLTQGGRDYKASWEDGQVTAAESGSPSDREVRVAMAAGLIDKTIVTQVLNVQIQDKRRDPLEIIGELGRLSPDQIAWLKRRTLAMRAARQFALADATYSLNNARSLVADPTVAPIDPRWLIYFGVVTYYPHERLEREVGGILDKAVKIAPDALASLAAFGFGEVEQPCIERLKQRAMSIPEIRKATPELDRHKALGLLYTLVACDCLEISQAADPPAPAPATPRPTRQRTPAPATRAVASGTVLPSRQAPIPTPTRAQGSQPVARPGGSGVSPTDDGGRDRLARGATPDKQPAVSWDTRQRERATLTRDELQQTAKGRRATHAVKLSSGFMGRKPITAEEVRELVIRKVDEMDSGADHFALLGVGRSAMEREIHDAYFHLAKRLHPDRIRAVGAIEMERDAQRLFARINQAFAVVTNPVKLFQYRKTLAAGGEAAVRKKQAAAERKAATIFAAEDQFRQGEMALNRGQFAAALEKFQKAVELNPDEGEHHAYLAWALWCATHDKSAATPKCNHHLETALRLSPKSAAVHYYRAMLAKQQGDEETARKLFQKVLEVDPNHRQAESELRLLTGRGNKKGGGLFGRR